MFNGEMILKYQLMPEDLDVLVTVKSDEDVRHMIDECDQHEQLGAPRLRAFLFPANPIVIHPPPVSISSACSSPRTLSETTNTAATNCSTNPESTTCHGRPSSLTRTRSSPSLCHQVATAGPNLNQYHHHRHQQPPQPHHHHKQPPQPQPHHFHQQPYQPPKPPLDRHPHKASGPEHLGRVRPTGVSEYFRQQTDHTSHSHGTNRVGHVYYQTGSPYDAYCGDSPPSPDVRSSSPGNRSGQ